jgi:hypothetical protein
MIKASWRNRIVWLALVAFGCASLAPAFAHWPASSGAGAGQGELCSVAAGGIASGSKPAPADHDSRDSHCPFCRLPHTAAPPSDAQPVAQAQFALFVPLEPAQFRAWDSALSRTPGSPRAPPQFS